MRVRKWRQHANSLLEIRCGNVCETHRTLPMLPHVPLRKNNFNAALGQPDPEAPSACAPEIAWRGGAITASDHAHSAPRILARSMHGICDLWQHAQPAAVLWNIPLPTPATACC